MRNLLYIILLFPLTAFGQLPGDSLPELPYRTDYYSDFETDISGWVVFNGGAVAHTGTQLRITNGTGGGKGGRLSGYTNEASTPYRLMFHIDSVTSAGVRVLSQWATTVDTVLGVGWHTVYFTSDASPGGFGNNIILAPADAGPDTVWISEMTLGRINEGRDIYSIGELEDTIGTRLRNTNKIWGNDFEYDIDGVNTFSIANISTPVNGSYRLNLIEGGDVVCMGCNEFQDTQSFEVTIDVTIVDSSIQLHSVWGTNNASPVITISESGIYSFNMSRRGPQANGNLDGLCINTENGGTVQVNDIVIRPIDYNTTQQQLWVELGANARVTGKLNPLTNYLNDGSVAIGYNSLVQSEGIAIGDSAIAVRDTTYGAEFGAIDMLALGNKSKAYSGRATALGNRTHAGGQSSTAVGTGAVVLTSHGVAVGRGSFLGVYESETGNTFNTDAINLYLSNGWAHRFDTPLSGIGIGEDTTPSDVEVKIYAQDAYDSRETPSDFNVAAGHLGLYSGRGTGTGEGGELRFYTAPQAGVSQNIKNTPVMSGKFDSDASVSDGTDLWLLDRSDDTMKRVRIKDTSSAGSNKIVGFSTLYVQ